MPFDMTLMVVALQLTGISNLNYKQAVAQIPFRLSENVLKTAQRNFYLGNNP